jgi:beta-galactosidase GanA
MIYYVGAWLDSHSQTILIKHILQNAAIKSIELPAGVEWASRVRPDGQDVHFLINHENKNQSVRLPYKTHDHLNDQDLNEECQLAPYSVLVLTQLENKSIPFPSTGVEKEK